MGQKKQEKLWERILGLPLCFGEWNCLMAEYSPNNRAFEKRREKWLECFGKGLTIECSCEYERRGGIRTMPILRPKKAY